MSRKRDRKNRTRRHHGTNVKERRPQFEKLEDRRVLAATLVNTAFDGGVPSNVRLIGSARYQGGSWIELTPAVSGKTGTLMLAGHGQAASDFTVRFNQSIKNSTTEPYPADGLAFGYGALPGTGWGNSGPGQTDGQKGPVVNGLFVKFDTYPNVGRIQVFYNRQEITPRTWPTFNIIDAGFVGNGPSDSLRGTFMTTQVSMNSTTKVLTVTHPALGTRTVAIPNWNPSSNWRFGWGASTGFFNDRHILEDLYVRDSTPNAAPVLSYTGTSDDRLDTTLPTFSWDVSDVNGNLNTHSMSLQQRQQDGSWLAIRTVTQGANSTTTAVEGHALAMLPSDLEQYGFGEFRVVMVATDKTGRSSTDYSPTVNVADDDPLGPLVTASVNGVLPITDGGLITLPYQEAASLTWSITDQQLYDGRLTDSGVESASIRILQGNDVVASASTIAGSLPLSGLGPGVYDLVIDAVDGDRDHGANATTDQATTQLLSQFVLTNQPPDLRVGLDRTVGQRQTSRFRVLDYSDANGDPVSVAWSFDDGITFIPGTEVDYSFPLPGTYTVLAKAEDPFGAAAVESIEVTVNNAPPRIVDVLHANPYAVGEAVNLQVIADDEPQSGLTYQVDWNSDGIYDESNGSGIFSSVLPAGVQVISLRVSDSAGLATITNVAVAIGDLPANPPTVTLSPSATSLVEGSDLTITATLSEATTVDVAVPLQFSGDADTADYSAPARLIIVPAGQTTGSITLNLVDDPVFEGDETLTIDAANAIAADVVAASFDVVIIDNESTPEFWFSSAGDLLPESSGAVRFSAQISHPSDEDILVPLDLTGSATPAADFSLPTPNILFEAGQTFGVIDLTVYDDDDPEVLETLLFRLGTADQVELSNDPAVSTEYLVRIPANDAPSAAFGSTYLQTIESAGSIVLTANLSAPPATLVELTAAVSGNAPVPVGFSGLTFQFAPGQTTATASLPILNDILPGAEDYAVVTLVGATGATIGSRSQAVVAIADDDIATVGFAATTFSLSESSTTYSVSVTLDQPVPESITLPVSIRGGTATAGGDYWIGDNPASSSMPLTIPAGLQTAQFTVTVVEDADIERDEYFTLELGQPLNQLGAPSIAQLGPASTHRGVIENDDVAARVVGVAQTVTEGQGSIDIEVQLTGKADEPVEVQLRLRGTSDPGSEVYFDDGPTKTIPFAPGETRKGLKIYIADDNRAEYTEYVDVIATSTVNIIGDPQRLVITDTDRVSASFATSDSRYSEGQGQFPIPIRLSNVAEFDTTVLVKDPRKGDPEFVTIPAGVQQVDYWSDTMNDDGLDHTKYVVFRLVAGIGVDVQPGAAHQVIIDDDDRRGGLLGDLEYSQFINKGNWDEFIDSSERKLADLLGIEGGRISLDTLNDVIVRSATEAIQPDNLIGSVISTGVEIAVTAYTGGNVWAGRAAGFAAGQAWAAAVEGVQAMFPEYTTSDPEWFVRARETAIEQLQTQVSTMFAFGVDGPLVGGKLFFDANKNGTLDFLDIDGDGYQDPNEPAEPLMDGPGNGLFAIAVPAEFDVDGDGKIEPAEGQLAIVGAIDESTGLELQTPLTAPFGSVVVSPLTTLASELVNRHETTLDEAAMLVLQSVGISIDASGFRLYVDDPVLRTAQGESDAAVAFAQGAMVHNTVDQIAGFISGVSAAPNERTAGIATYAILADGIFNDDRVVLTNPYTVASLAGSVAASLGLAMNATDLQTLGQVIAAGNQQISSLPITPDLAYLESIATVQKVSQGVVADALNNFASGQLTTQSLLDQATGNGLANLIATTEPGKLVDSEIHVSDGRVVEGDSGQALMEFEVTLTYAAKQEVAVRYEAIDVNDATEGVDFAQTYGELTWLPGETDTKTVSVPIYGDTEFEGEEAFEFWVHTPTNALISRQVGLGFIADDDPFTHTVSDLSNGEILVQFLSGGRTILVQDNQEIFNRILGDQQEIAIVSSLGNPMQVEFDLQASRDYAGQWTVTGSEVESSVILQDALAESIVFSDQHDNRYVEVDGLRINLHGSLEVESNWKREVATTGVAEEGATVVLNLQDPSTDSALPLLADWTVSTETGPEITERTSTLQVHAADDAVYSVQARQFAENGPLITHLSDLVFVNLAPTLSVSADAVVIDEGSSASKTIAASDVPADTVEVKASIGVIDEGEPGSWTWSYTGVDDLSTTTVTITATDEDGGKSSATFDLTVNNLPPTVADGNFTIAENSPFGTLVGSLIATDPGNDSLTFTVTGGQAATAFAIDPATGEISVADSSPLDFETTTTFDLEVTVSDGDGGVDTANVQIDLSNLASISGVVFVDVDQDGLYDANEPGIDGVTIELRDQNGNAILDTHGDAITNLTSDGGFYWFEDLAPGTYQLQEVQPTGVADGKELLGTLGGSILGDDTLQLTITDVDAYDYAFAEIGQQVASGDAAGIGFWQNKHGQALIASGENNLAIWLTERFGNVFGDRLVGATGYDVADFYRNELFKQKAKKSAGPAKVDAQFMAVALATYFTSSQLAGNVATHFGFNVTQTGIGTRVVNVGSAGAAFDVANHTEMTILQLLDATNAMTDQPDSIDGFAHIYDQDGSGSIDLLEEELRRLANELYGWINQQGGI